MTALPDGVRSIESGNLAELEAYFSRPLATLPVQQGFMLIGGKVEDQRISGTAVTCRVVSLLYEHPFIGGRVAISSVCPGEYIRRYAQQAFKLERITAQLGALPGVAMTVDGRPYYMAAQGDTEYILETDADVQVLEMVSGWVTFVGQEFAWDIPAIEAGDAVE